MAIKVTAKKACPEIKDAREGHVHCSAGCYSHICLVGSSSADTSFQKTVVCVSPTHTCFAISGGVPVPRHNVTWAEVTSTSLETSTSLCSSKILHLLDATEGHCLGQDGGQPDVQGRKDGNVHGHSNGPICWTGSERMKEVST